MVMGLPHSQQTFLFHVGFLFDIENGDGQINTPPGTFFVVILIVMMITMIIEMTRCSGGGFQTSSALSGKIPKADLKY